MAPKKENSKAAAAKGKKAENQTQVDAAKKKAQDAKETEEWSKGAKGKSSKDEKAEKAKEAAARKAEAARLLAEEEASLPSKPAKAPSGVKAGKAVAKSAPAAAVPASRIPDFDAPTVESFSASGLDDALDLMTLVTEKTDKASVGAKAASTVETHPERRFKAAFEAYKERELPALRKDRPGMRLQQYHDILYKDFQKSPDNPFNQVMAAYDAKKEDKVAVLKKQRDETEQRLRTTE